MIRDQIKRQIREHSHVENSLEEKKEVEHVGGEAEQLSLEERRQAERAQSVEDRLEWVSMLTRSN